MRGKFINCRWREWLPHNDLQVWDTLQEIQAASGWLRSAAQQQAGSRQLCPIRSLEDRSKEHSLQICSPFISWWVHSVISHIYTLQQVARHGFHKTPMKNFTLRPNKCAQCSLGDWLGSAWPSWVNRKTAAGPVLVWWPKAHSGS